MDENTDALQPGTQTNDVIQQTKYVSLREQIAFYFSALFRDMSYAVMGQASTFFIDVLGLRRERLGILMLAEKFWDGINDPLMGAYFDRRAYANEKARRFFKTTALPIAILLVLMFSPIRFSSNEAVNGWLCMLFMFLCYVPFEALHTLNGTAYMSYYNSITPNIQERSGVISRARLFSTMGSAAVGGGIPLFYGMVAPENVQGKKIVFFLIAVVVALAFLIYNALMYTQVKERIVSPPQPQQKIGSMFRGLLQNKLFFILIASNTIAGLISRGNTDMYFYTYNIGGSEWQTIIGLVGLPSLLIATWMLPKLCQRFEKRTIVLACSAARFAVKLIYLLIGSFTVSLNLLSLNTGVQAKIFMALITLAYTLPDTLKGSIYWSMIADSVDYQEWKTGKRNDGTIYAMEGLAAKIVGAVGTLSTSIIIEIIHFQENAPLLEQAPSALRGLFVVPLCIELISIAVSTVPYFFYDLKRKGHAKIIEELKLRSEAAVQADV